MELLLLLPNHLFIANKANHSGMEHTVYLVQRQPSILMLLQTNVLIVLICINGIQFKGYARPLFLLQATL